MNKETLIQQFRENHLAFIKMVQSLPDGQQHYSYAGKWNALQQFMHLILVLQPIAHLLPSKEKIRERFGVLTRPVMRVDELLAHYAKGLGQGGKAPERYLPAAEIIESAEDLSVSLGALLKQIGEQLMNYSEEELDTLVLPHPFLGNLALREMFYLMAYHPLHHAKQVKDHLQHFQD